MNKKIVAGILLVIMFPFALSAFSFTKDSTKNIGSNNLNISGNVSLNENGEINAIRPEVFFWTPILKKSFIGVKMGYTISKKNYNKPVDGSSTSYWDDNYLTSYSNSYEIDNSLLTHDLYLGLTYRRNFYNHTKTPFWGCEFQLDLINIQFPDQNIPKEVNSWNFGSCYFINLGYTWQMTGKPWGLEVCYSLGLSYLNNTYSKYINGDYVVQSRRYEMDLISYLRLGYTYYFN